MMNSKASAGARVAVGWGTEAKFKARFLGGHIGQTGYERWNN